MPRLSLTHLNLADVERRLRDVDPRLKHFLLEMVEQHIGIEQAINDLKSLVDKLVLSAAVEVKGMAILKQQLNRIERRYSGTSNLSFEDPTRKDN